MRWKSEFRDQKSGMESEILMFLQQKIGPDGSAVVRVDPKEKKKNQLQG